MAIFNKRLNVILDDDCLIDDNKLAAFLSRCLSVCVCVQTSGGKKVFK